MADSTHLIPSKLHPLVPQQGFAIDRGSVLTKLIYRDLSNNAIAFHTFPSRELEQHLQILSPDLKRHNVDGKINVRITGIDQNHSKSIVTSLFTANVTLVEELDAMTRGLGAIIKYSDGVDIFLKADVSYRNEHVFDKDHPVIKRFTAKMKSALEDCSISDNGQLSTPAIVVWAGANIKYYLLKSDNSVVLVHVSYFGGKTYTGLANHLIGTNDYDEISGLALKGKRENVDTQADEVFSDDPNSPYGMVPPKLPIFSFGKCGDHDIGIKDFKKEDLMTSLSNFIVWENFFAAMQLCQAYKINTVYIGGNAFSAPVFRRLIQFRQKMMFAGIKIMFLNGAYVPALGALMD